MNLIFYEQMLTLQGTWFWIGYKNYSIIQQGITDHLLCGFVLDRRDKSSDQYRQGLLHYIGET